MVVMESDFPKKATAATPRCVHASWKGLVWVESCAARYIPWFRVLTSLEEDPGKRLSQKNRTCTLPASLVSTACLSTPAVSKERLEQGFSTFRMLFPLKHTVTFLSFHFLASDWMCGN